MVVSKKGAIAMELLQLKYFCESATSENFSKTANKFGVPPSDISQSIRRLERELGVPLFTRRANSITLNDIGRQFYKRISKALVIIADAAAEATNEKNGGKIKICINTNRRVVMDVIEKYRRRFPDVEIITNHFTDPTADEFDMIIESDDLRLEGYERNLMLSEDMLIAMRRDNPLADAEKIDISMLSELPFVTMSEKSSLYRITNDICRAHGFKPKIAMQSDDPFYVRKCVELGLGVTFAPSVSWSGQFSDEIILKPLPGYKRDTYVYTNPKKHIPLCAKQFLNMLLDINK